jgi:hypothetical protein
MGEFGTLLARKSFELHFELFHRFRHTLSFLLYAPESVRSVALPGELS